VAALEGDKKGLLKDKIALEAVKEELTSEKEALAAQSEALHTELTKTSEIVSALQAENAMQQALSLDAHHQMEQLLEKLKSEQSRAQQLENELYGSQCATNMIAMGAAVSCQVSKQTVERLQKDVAVAHEAQLAREAEEKLLTNQKVIDLETRLAAAEVALKEQSYEKEALQESLDNLRREMTSVMKAPCTQPTTMVSRVFAMQAWAIRNAYVSEPGDDGVGSA